MTASDAKKRAEREFLLGVTRAFGGALVFSLPMFMTMEMWELGFAMHRLKLAMLVLTLLPVLHGLAYFCGFEETTGYGQAALDAMVAFAVACITSACMLGMLGLLTRGMSTSEIVGEIIVQAVPGSFGALLAQSQFGIKEDEDRKRREAGSLGAYFFMAVGALYLASSVAPTEEVNVLAYKVTHGQVVLIAIASLGIMHAFVYGMGFRGQPEPPPDVSGWALFLRYTVAGYAMSLGSSTYLLWIVGRLDSADLTSTLKMIFVLGFPAAVGAATARLVL